MIKIRFTTPQDPPEYPCLKVSPTGRIVLFQDYNAGTVLGWTSESIKEVGIFSKEWTESTFKPFKGSITLSNDD